MRGTLRIIPLSHLPESASEAAALLYWEAFSGKLSRLLGEGDRALPLLRAGLDPDHALAAVTPEGLLAGIAGYRSSAGSFISLSPALLRQFYGRAGAAWRLGALQLLRPDTENERFLIDGLSVASPLRGQGIGRALLGGLESLARSRGYPALRLDVAENNPRARALYERCGYRVVRRQALPFAGPVFGLRASLMMEYRFPQA